MYSCISLWLLPTPHSQMLINVEVNTTKKVALVKSNATGTSGPSFFFFSSRICQYLRTELFCACHSQTFTSAVIFANRLSKCLVDGEQPVVQDCKEITSCPAPPKTLPKGPTAATRTIVLLAHIQPCTPTHTLANFSHSLSWFCLIQPPPTSFTSQVDHN